MFNTTCVCATLNLMIRLITILLFIAPIFFGCEKDINEVIGETPSLAMSATDSSTWVIFYVAATPKYSDTLPIITSSGTWVKVSVDMGNSPPFTVENDKDTLTIHGRIGFPPNDYLYLVQDWNLRSKILCKYNLSQGDYNSDYIARIKYAGRWTREVLVAGCDPNNLPCNWVPMAQY